MAASTSSARTSHPILPRNAACLECRKRKQRCDGTKPECYECVDSGRKCQYEDQTYRTRTQQLQDRIKELESQIRTIKGKRGIAPSSTSPSQSASDSSQTRSSSEAALGHSSGLCHAPRDPPHSSGAVSLASPPVLSPSGMVFPQAPTSNSSEVESNLLGSTQFELSPDVINGLLDTFKLHHAQCAFELHMDRVMQGLQPGAVEPTIPALKNAILLMACHFAEDRLRIWEDIFLERTKREIESNIIQAHGGGEGAYNALHHLQAMVMLGMYYYFKGRLLEGHVNLSQAARFAVTLGVHQLNSRIFQPDSSSTGEPILGVKRWRPRDAIELGEAINLWWSCSTWDQGGSTLNGLPPTVLFEEITTVWPRLLSEYESGYILPDDDYSVASLFDPELSYTIADVSGDNVKSLFAKAGVLMQCSLKVDTERMSHPHGTNEWWSTFEQCDRSMTRFMQTMPPVHLARSVEELTGLVMIHIAIYCGVVQLHGALAEYEAALGAQGDPRCIRPDGTLGGLSHDRCTEACRAAVLATNILAGTDMGFLHMFMGIGWVCVSEAVVREIPRLRKLGLIVQAEEKERQWEVVERCMERLVTTYPVIGLQLEQLREKKREQLTQMCQTS